MRKDECVDMEEDEITFLYILDQIAAIYTLRIIIPSASNSPFARQDFGTAVRPIPIQETSSPLHHTACSAALFGKTPSTCVIFKRVCDFLTQQPTRSQPKSPTKSNQAHMRPFKGETFVSFDVSNS